MKKRMVSLLITLCMVLSLLPTVAFAAENIENETTPNGQYYLSYYNADNTIKPTVSGTDNAPVLTFEREAYRMSGGVITSNYTMDFTRSFNIEGSVAAAERDGVSFALHTTKNKKAFYGGHNTGMMGANLLQTWAKTDTRFTVTSDQNDITRGLLWDFMTFNSKTYYMDKRFHKGAYSYQIEDTTTVKALPDKTSGELGMKSYTNNTLNGDFTLSWQCTDSSNATGNLTLQMGSEITFTYTNLNASSIFGNLAKAKAVYFSFATFMPAFTAGGDGNETVTQTKITIDKAYYTDTDDGSGKSTLGVETSYYIDTDGNSTYETQLKKATLVGPDQTVLCRNKIYNLNKNATSSMDMTLLIPNLSKATSSGESKIASICNENFYTHANGESTETLDKAKMSTQGNGPLNSTAPLTDYVKVTLPAGGDGTDAYADAYAVYEYTFIPGENTTALNQTIQLGVAPFTPAVLSSTVFFNSPEAFKPDNTEGKILFGTDGAGGSGLYRVVAKDNTSVTLFYNGADIAGGGMEQSTANTWLNGDFWNTLTEQEQAALLPYGDGIDDKVVLPSEDEVRDAGIWGLDDAARATAENAEDSTNWWLRTLGSDNTAKAVTQNGTQIVDIATTQTNGIRPVMRLNLANVLFTKDSKVNLTNSPSGTLTQLSAVGDETAPFRLTLLDTTSNFAVREDSRTIDVSVGDSITFEYTGATVGENCYVSALLTNRTGQDIYYGRLKAISSDTDANGTATVTIPTSGLSNGTYILKLFSETIHADKASDVASALQSITCALGNNLNGTVSITGTAEYGCTLTATVTNSNVLGTLQYQWKRNGSAIAGATDSSYVLTSEDIGTAVICEVRDSGESPRDNFISSTAKTIAKRTLIAKADNKQITTGQTLPQFTVTCSGFVYDNTVENIFAATPTASVAEAVDGKTSGTFPITVTAELVTGMDDLYQLSTQAGTLTVSTPNSGSDRYTVPISSKTGSVNVSATVTNRIASVTVTDKQLEAVIDSAKQTGIVAVDLSGIKNVDSVKIPAKLIKASAEGTSATGLQVALPTGAVVFDKIALASVSNGKDLTISVTNIKPSNLTAVQKETLGDKLDSAVVVDVNVLINGEKVTNFNGGKITVSMPYTPKNGEDTSKLTVWYIKDDGSIENVGGTYNAASKCFVFTTTHLSRYILVSDTTVTNFFADVASGAYYYDAVLWAVKNGVTSGTGATTFNPNGICTRAQAVTFLWRAMGSPEPTGTNNPFTDVSKGAYYYKAILWAVENGITKGTSATTFVPDTTVSRSQSVTFLWRAVGETTVTTENPFADVSDGAYYKKAVLWAVEHGITDGTGKSTFSPDMGCSRAQSVTFLWRNLKK